MVARPDIDVVDIATPPSTHAEIAIAAAKAGKHIFCEKPFTATVEEAERALEAVTRAGVKHMLGFNYRRVPALPLPGNSSNRDAWARSIISVRPISRTGSWIRSFRGSGN